MSGQLSWRGLWTLFAQAVTVLTAVAFVFGAHNHGFWRNESPLSYSAAVSRAAPSVVSIHGRDDTGANDSVGAGVIVSDDGYILTNYHLIADVSAIEVGLTNGDSRVAEVVGVDPEIDIAVLRINADYLPAIVAADDSRLAPGDVVFAIGNPFGLNRSTTMGIVSAIERDRLGLHGFERFIQTDAAINPGSSGGALANVAGELVGINSALFYRRRGVAPQGIGFAVPAGLAMRSYRRLIGESPPPGDDWGAEIRSIPPRLRGEVIADDVESSMLVVRVWKGWPAAAIGVRVGDIILHVDGAPPEDRIDDKEGRLKTAPASLSVWRNGAVINLPPAAPADAKKPRN